MIRAVAVSGRFELRTCAEAALGPLDVSVRIAYVGICGSELHLLHADDGESSGPELELGHEWSGVVDAVGPGVGRVGVGDRVTARTRLPCRGCPHVPACRPTQCRAWRRPGSGAWADRIVLDEEFLVPLPAGTSLRSAALTEPLACALRGVELAGTRPGDASLVIGGGPIGILAGLAARLGGASRVVISEPAAPRRAIAESLGFAVEDPNRPGLDPGPFAAVYEAVGVAGAVASAIERVALGGTVVVLGVSSPGERVAFSPFDVFAREVTIRGAWGIETTFGSAVALLEVLDVSRLVTHEIPLAEIEAGVALARSGEAMKVLLVPDPDLIEEAP